MDASAAEFLQEIAESLRALSPTLTRLRQKFPNHTLLPNLLSPIQPGLAFGYDLVECPRIRQELYKTQAWQKFYPMMVNGYNNFCEKSGNEILWVAWNFWRPDISGNIIREIQLITGTNKEFSDFISNETELFSFENTKLTTKEYYDKGKGRIECMVPQELQKKKDEINNIRDYADGMWTNLFISSMSFFFQEKGLPTIVDFIKCQFDDLFEGDPNLNLFYRIAQPIAVHFDDVETYKDVKSIFLNSDNCSHIWDWTKKLAHRTADKDSSKRLISTWTLAAQEFAEPIDEVPKQVLEEMSKISETLGIGNKNQEAYVILQHICWLYKSMRASYQYIIPIIFGKHICIMYLVMGKKLKASELTGWYQIALQLFGTLFVEYLTDIKIEYDRQKRSEEQRRMLSHSIPKFVFKPIEYMLISIWNSITLKIPHEKQISNLAKSALLLVSRGQAELADYAGFENSEIKDKTYSVNLIDICKKIEAIFCTVSKFFIAGRIDRIIKVKNKYLRDNLANLIKFKLSVDNCRDQNARIIGNPAVITMHIWNLIDNAFRFANFSTRRFHDEHWILNFRIKCNNPEFVELEVSSEGIRIPDEKLKCLNNLFSTPSKTSEFRKLENEIVNWNKSEINSSGLQPEDRGQGLSRFSRYLDELWIQKGQKNYPRGHIESEKTGWTTFCFKFPKG